MLVFFFMFSGATSVLSLALVFLNRLLLLLLLPLIIIINFFATTFIAVNAIA